MFAYTSTMDPMLLALIAIIVPLTAVFGGYAWLRFQRRFGWSSKSVLVLNLMLLALIPLWGCVGFSPKTTGCRRRGMYVLAVWFGCVWVPRRFGRALFSELIPAGHEADMFALFEITDKGSSCWDRWSRRRCGSARAESDRRCFTSSPRWSCRAAPRRSTSREHRERAKAVRGARSRPSSRFEQNTGVDGADDVY